ncbi:unnamed protein product [Tenebrio molitor]|nr:unnamed protein product [Tenebrio molitor]
MGQHRKPSGFLRLALEQKRRLPKCKLSSCSFSDALDLLSDFFSLFNSSSSFFATKRKNFC